MTMPEPLTLPDGGSLPPFLYGTAWKEERTQELVRMALEAGFRGIDTANQRRHYHEAGVGAALAQAFGDGLVTRDELFVQTKFTHRPGQDERLPYDESAPIGVQVEQSFRSSLEHLGVERLDSLVLHGPLMRDGLHPLDLDAWRAMEAIQESGGTRVLGVSNVSLMQLEALCDFARVRPLFVQNRTYAQLGWDAPVRAFCREQGLIHQPFSLLTANPEVVHHPEVGELAASKGCTTAQLIFAFTLRAGCLPLTGTSSPEHARLDLAAAELDLSREEMALVEASSLPPGISLSRD
jgi:diketogulonate reductase-like aldo/keto reductase